MNDTYATIESTASTITKRLIENFGAILRHCSCRGCNCGYWRLALSCERDDNGGCLSRFKVQGSKVQRFKGSWVLALRLLPEQPIVAQDFTQLDAWQLSKDLHLLVLQFLARPSRARDLKFRDQFDDAAASASRNIAEGFGRFSGIEFAQFLKVALGSLAETRNHLMDARDRGYISKEEQHRGDLLARRAIGATTALRSYLLSPRNTTSQRRTYKPRKP